MSLLNNSFLNADGSSVTGRVPTKLAVNSKTDTVMTPQQEAAIKSAYKVFCSNVRLSTASYHVQNLDFPDGMKARLISNNGVDTVQVWVDRGGALVPCVDLRIEQNDDSTNIKGVLKEAPGVLYGKQVGDKLFLDADKNTPEIEEGHGLKNFSLPAAEGDTYLFKAPWHKKATILFGRDKHYCPFPKSSVKVGHRSWPCAMELPDGQRKVWIFDVKVDRRQGSNWMNESSDTVVTVTERDDPDTVLCEITLPAIRPLREYVNATLDGTHAMLVMTQMMEESSPFENNLSLPVADPWIWGCVEFEVTADGGTPVVTAADMSAASFDPNLFYGYSFRYFDTDPLGYMTPFAPHLVRNSSSPDSHAIANAKVIQAGYNKYNERVVISYTFQYEDDGAWGAARYSIYRNSERVYTVLVTDPGPDVPPNPSYVTPEYMGQYVDQMYHYAYSYWANEPYKRMVENWRSDYYFFGITALTNNVVTIGIPQYIGEDWLVASDTSGTGGFGGNGIAELYSPNGIQPVRSVKRVKGLVLVAFDGPAVELEQPTWFGVDYENYTTENPPIYIGPSIYSSRITLLASGHYELPNAFKAKRKVQDEETKDEYKANDARAGVSWNPVTGELAVEAEVLKEPPADDPFALYLNGVGFVGPIAIPPQN